MRKEILDKAYGNMSKEISPQFDFDISPFRGVRYYWLLLVRKITR
jgi:hypothetical protein